MSDHHNHTLPEIIDWQWTLNTLGAGAELPPEAMAFAMDSIMAGEASDARIAAFIYGIYIKGITPAELDAAADAMLSFATRPHLTGTRQALDLVGTGGDGHHTVNISTMSSVVVGAAGVHVMKHGNRAASSKSGGADMLEALGVDLGDGRLRVPEYPEFKLTFLFARNYHPAMKFAGPVRSQLAAPTLFNLLGPLTNPAQPGSSLIGCAFQSQMETMAHTYARRGQQVLVVRGCDGVDEITIAGPSDVYVVADGEVRHEVLDPRDLGFTIGQTSDLRGGDPAFNADVARRVWANELHGPIRDAVVLNSAAALAAHRGLGGQSLIDAMTATVAETDQILASGVCADIISAAVNQ